MTSDPTYLATTVSSDPADYQPRWLTPAGLIPTTLPEHLKRRPLWAWRPWMRYGLFGAAGLLLVIGAIAKVGSHKSSAVETPAAVSQALPVQTLAAEPISSYQVPRTYTGEITAVRKSELGFERGGELAQVMAREGQSVSKGDPLARLNNQNLAAQRLEVKAQKAQAEAKLAELENGARPEDIAVAQAAVRDLEQQLSLQEIQQQRRQVLYSKGAISREQLDEFTYGSNSLQAKLDQAKSTLQALENGTRSEQVNGQKAAVSQLQAQLKNIDINLAKSTVTAPFDGVVAERKADEGTVVSTGQSVVQVVEATAPEARIGVPVDVVTQLPVGSVQTVQVNNQPYQAKVSAISPEVDTTTRTRTVVLKLSGATLAQVEPGQTAQMTVAKSVQAKGYWLPIEALTEGIRGLWTCYVLVPGDRRGTFVTEARAVEVIQQESGRALVRGTLETGDRVIANGVHRVVAGQQVQPVGK